MHPEKQPPDQPAPATEDKEISREANDCARAIVSLCEQRGAKLTMEDCSKVVLCVGYAMRTARHHATRPGAADAPIPIAEREPVFPCWLWCPQEHSWSHASHTAAEIAKRFTVKWFPFTHWLPDQPTALADERGKELLSTAEWCEMMASCAKGLAASPPSNSPVTYAATCRGNEHAYSDCAAKLRATTARPAARKGERT